MSLVNREISESAINNINIPNGYEKVNSINVFDPKEDLNIKLLIVGTITPPDGAGYYYTSKGNRIYGYIDEALGKTELKANKLKLRDAQDAKQKEACISAIKDDLSKVGIAFIDIAKTVIRKKNSSADEDIKNIVLDYDAFRCIKHVDNIICNSNDALECFNRITNNKYNPIPLSQRRGKKTEWLDAIRKYTN